MNRHKSHKENIAVHNFETEKRYDPPIDIERLDGSANNAESIYELAKKEAMSAQ